MPLSKWILVLGFGSWLLVPGQAGADSTGEDEDEKILAKARVPSEGEPLLKFLRQRTLTDTEREQLEQRIQDLGSRKFVKRRRATQELIAQGALAIPFLKRALRNQDVEVVTRASKCLEKIQRAPASSPEVPGAVIRQLVRLHPAKAVPTLLAYLPFAGDEAQTEEIMEGLLTLSQKPHKVDPALVSALHDKQAVRLGVAAYVLGQVGDAKTQAEVRRLLSNTNITVRFRAAHGLLAARDRSAVPVLIGLVREGPTNLAWQAGDLLARVAAEKTPSLAFAGQDEDARKKAAGAWENWWRDQGAKIDWKRVEVGLPGGALVAELESNTIWESGPGGKTRWEIEDLQGPYDVQMLAGGRALVAEYLGQQVTERDRKGTVLWKKEIERPVSCRRLPNGHTFIATTRGVVELGTDGKEVFSYTLQKTQLPVYCAHRPAHGTTIYIVCEEGLLALDTSQRKMAQKKIDVAGKVEDVQGLPDGNLLLTLTQGKDASVAVVTPAGRTVSQVKVPPGACSATRLANGHILAVSKSQRFLAQVDATGKVVWKKRTDGRPIRVYRR
jgi:HEAT repeat protein